MSKPETSGFQAFFSGTVKMNINIIIYFINNINRHLDKNQENSEFYHFKKKTIDQIDIISY